MGAWWKGREQIGGGGDIVPTGSPILLRRPLGCWSVSSSSASLVVGMMSPPSGCSVGFSCLSAMSSLFLCGGNEQLGD